MSHRSPRRVLLLLAGAVGFAHIRAEVTLARPVLGEVVHHRELYYGGEDKREREEDEEVQGGGIGDFREVGSRLEP